MKSVANLSTSCRICILTMVIITGSTHLFSGESMSLPPSLLPAAKALDTVETRVMPGVDVEALLADDARRGTVAHPAPTRFATALNVAFTPENSGSRETLANGSQLWRLRISSPGALSLNLGLSRFSLPTGASFWVHNSNGAWVQGPYTTKNRNASGGLWTAVVLGDEIVAELLIPSGAGTADLEISSVNHGYRFFGEDASHVAAKRGECNVNVVCPEGDSWRNQIRSVARITISGQFLCTGQLVNNTAQDNTPYLLTAQHCVEDANEAPSIVAYWNYQSPACEDLAGGSLSQTQSGSTFIASYELGDGSDFALVELDEQPQQSYQVYYSGWDSRDNTPVSAVTIHHPGGDEKSISFENDPLTVTSYLGTTSPGDGNYFRVEDWDTGTTEGGSSGACLFDPGSGLCIGTLSGGFAACSNIEPDWYGRMARHWTGGGTPETRLSDWLDPLATGVFFLPGKDAAGSGESETWLVPAVASLPGEPPSNWKSQIAVTNPGTEARNASIYFVAKGEAWPGELHGGPYMVVPNGSLYIDDLLLPENPTSGLVYVTVDGPGTAVFVRTYNLVPDGATFGQGQPGILLDDAVWATELVLPLIHSSPGVFRTNLGFAQISAGTYTVEVEIYSAEGLLLATKSYSQSAAWRQINDVFANMGIGGQVVEGGWIRVILVGGSPAFWTTYATVIDSRTNDPTYVLPVAP